MIASAIWKLTMTTSIKVAGWCKTSGTERVNSGNSSGNKLRYEQTKYLLSSANYSSVESVRSLNLYDLNSFYDITIGLQCYIIESVGGAVVGAVEIAIVDGFGYMMT